MAGILSQEEVDALIHGLGEGKLPAGEEEKRDASGVVPYDLTTHERIIRGKMPTLEIINEKYARLFRTTLQSMLRRVVNITPLGTSIIKFHEYLRSLPVPSSIQVVKLDPLRGNSIFVIDSKVIFTLVDIIFGGTGKEPYKVEGREFTAIENNLIQRVIAKALSDFESAWSYVINLTASYQKTEINPQFCLITLPTDPVVVMTFLIELEHSSGKMTICIPYSVLEPLREKLNSRFQGDQSDNETLWISKFKLGLMLASVNVTAEIGRVGISSGEVINLRKGDVIMMDKHYFDPFDIFVEGAVKFKGTPGIYKGNYAIQINQIARSDEEHQHGE
ncbi:MAG: flagellar motor switch protein FliM [Smithellaceae bacterium]|nr:flagellar motor switch protein FliM [Smithellaceae bacterium]